MAAAAHPSWKLGDVEVHIQIPDFRKALTIFTTQEVQSVWHVYIVHMLVLLIPHVLLSALAFLIFQSHFLGTVLVCALVGSEVLCECTGNDSGNQALGQVLAGSKAR